MKKGFPEIRKILSTGDIVAKVICVVLSVILWAYISNTNIGEIKFKIPIIFTNLPDTLVKTKMSSRYVTITLTGRKDTLKNVNVKSIKALVNLEQPEINVSKNYPIEVIRDEIPDNIELKLSNREVALFIERKISKKVSVKINIIDKVPEGYVLGKIRVIPDSVTLSGPESLLRDIDHVQTKAVSIANNTGRINREVFIDNSNLEGVNLDISRVRVIIPVIESANLFKFTKSIVIKNKNDRFNYILSQEEATVYLQASGSDIIPTEDDFELFIDIASSGNENLFTEENQDFIEKNFTIEVEIKKEGVKLISIFPDVVSVKILKK